MDEDLAHGYVVPAMQNVLAEAYDRFGVSDFTQLIGTMKRLHKKQTLGDLGQNRLPRHEQPFYICNFQV